MPTSPSRSPRVKLPPVASGPKIQKPLLALAAVAALIVALISLPASMLRRCLPAAVSAGDFSGTIWHGSAGAVTLGGRNLGAIEWHLHPWSLLALELRADLHWVRIGFVADGTVNFSPHGVLLHDLKGGGPLEDLHDLGVAPGFSGTTSFDFTVVQVDFGGGGGGATLVAVSGDLHVADLASPNVADGADLGSYRLHTASPIITPGTDVAARLTDTGGPLGVEATVHFSADGHTGMLSGTVKAREDASPALKAQVDNLAQLHARDAAGGIPIDLEFTL